MNPELRDILFLDIETVAATSNYDSLAERLKIQWARKASFFKQKSDDATDESLYHERAGIYAEFGRVIVIGMGKFAENDGGEMILKTKVLADHNEFNLLSAFKAILDKMDPGARLCAHNGKEFDFPYLSRRMLVHSLALPSQLNLSGRKPWEIPHIDTLDMWKFGDHKNYTSLDLLAALFNLPTSKGLMDGSQVNAVYYNEQDLEKISAYCLGDVVAVAQLYLRLKGFGTIDPQNIFHT